MEGSECECARCDGEGCRETEHLREQLKKAPKAETFSSLIYYIYATEIAHQSLEVDSATWQ